MGQWAIEQWGNGQSGSRTVGQSGNPIAKYSVDFSSVRLHTCHDCQAFTCDSANRLRQFDRKRHNGLDAPWAGVTNTASAAWNTDYLYFGWRVVAE